MALAECALMAELSIRFPSNISSLKLHLKICLIKSEALIYSPSWTGLEGWAIAKLGSNLEMNGRQSFKLGRDSINGKRFPMDFVILQVLHKVNESSPEAFH